VPPADRGGRGGDGDELGLGAGERGWGPRGPGDHPRPAGDGRCPRRLWAGPFPVGEAKAAGRLEERPLRGAARGQWERS